MPADSVKQRTHGSTGTAAWNFVAISQAILGVKPGYDGLIVDPCIESDWKEYTVTRVFRGAKYIVHVSNPDAKQKGVRSISIDGKDIDGNVIPVMETGSEHNVEVVLRISSLSEELHYNQNYWKPRFCLQ